MMLKIFYCLHIVSSLWCAFVAYVWSTALVLQDNAITQGTINVMVSVFMLLRAMSLGDTIEAAKRRA